MYSGILRCMPLYVRRYPLTLCLCYCNTLHDTLHMTWDGVSPTHGMCTYPWYEYSRNRHSHDYFRYHHTHTLHATTTHYHTRAIALHMYVCMRSTYHGLVHNMLPPTHNLFVSRYTCSAHRHDAVCICVSRTFHRRISLHYYIYTCYTMV